MRHQGAKAPDMAGLCRPDDRADARQAAVPHDAGPQLVNHAGKPFVERVVWSREIQ